MYNGEQDIDYDSNVPEVFRVVQQSLNDFVAINYETALGLVSQPQMTESEILHYKSKVLDIIRNNPPLASLPKYLRDEREDYLWYSDFYDEKTMNLSTSVPCKGALSKVGIESYFSTVLYSKQMSIKDLEGYSNPLLNITDEERAIGVKYVFQTRLTKNTVNTRIRSPMGMWSTQETFIDNDTQAVLKRLEEYYS